MKPLILAMTLSLAMCLPGQAAGPLDTLTAAEAGLYLLDPDHSQIDFEVLHEGVSFYSGRFSGIAGELELETKVVEASRVKIAVPVASISTTSKALDEELREAAWLDVEKYPVMTFESSKIVAGLPGSADLPGTLTLHGVTKPLTLHVQYIGKGVDHANDKLLIGFRATAELKRSDFHLTRDMSIFGDTVGIRIDAAFEKK